MFFKLAVFGLGYLLGARAGRPRYEQIVKEARHLLRSEEISTAVGFARGGLWILRQRGRGAAARGAPPTGRGGTPRAGRGAGRSAP